MAELNLDWNRCRINYFQLLLLTSYVSLVSHPGPAFSPPVSAKFYNIITNSLWYLSAPLWKILFECWVKFRGWSSDKVVTFFSYEFIRQFDFRKLFLVWVFCSLVNLHFNPFQSSVAFHIETSFWNWALYENATLVWNGFTWVDN